MQTIRDAATLLILALVVVSVRISPAPDLTVVPEANASPSVSTAPASLLPIVHRESGTHAVKALRHAIESRLPAVSQKVTGCSDGKRHVLTFEDRTGQRRVLVVEFELGIESAVEFDVELELEPDPEPQAKPETQACLSIEPSRRT
jgi:hypothetical protein